MIRPDQIEKNIEAQRKADRRGFRKVTRLQTADGQLHCTDQSARRHADDLLFQAMDKFLTRIYPGAHRPSTTKAIQIMSESPEETKADFVTIMGRYNFGDEDE